MNGSGIQTSSRSSKTKVQSEIFSNPRKSKRAKPNPMPIAENHNQNQTQTTERKGVKESVIVRN